MTHTINLVRIFHNTFGHPVAKRLTPGDKTLRELRVKLIAEELGELCEALGVDLSLEVKDGVCILQDAQAVKEDHEISLVKAADALGDLDYVIQGANLAFGIPAEAVMAEIQRSNMSKLGDDGKPIYRDDGKILKGPNYRKPNIRAVLDRIESERCAAIDKAPRDELDPAASLRMWERWNGK